MCNLVKIVVAIVCLATLNQLNAFGANVAPTSGAFKKNQILRDADQVVDSSSSSSSTESKDESNEKLSLEDQVRLLTKQMNALMTRRREDFKLLENNLKKAMRKNAAQYADADLRAEMDELR